MSFLKSILEDSTPYDWALCSVLILLTLSGSLLIRSLAPAGNSVRIEVDGKLRYSLPLDEDRTVEVQGPAGTTEVEVRAGRVRISDSPCPNRLCVRQGWISKGAVICLPNRVVVTVGGFGERGVDAITG